jgi:hypothetical protein
MFTESKKTTVLMIALLCFSVTLMSSTAAPGSYSLSAAAENMAVGSGQCSDFLNGFTLGMAVASFLGCVWCPGAAIASKVVETFAC